MAKKKQKPATPKKLNDADWIQVVQSLIVENSNPRKRSTNRKKWIMQLYKFCELYVEVHAKEDYDGNMAVSALMGRVLVVWYTNVHRAKGYDPNRPLARRKAIRQVERYKAELIAAINSDELMGKAFGKHQQWNFPFGKGAKGGNFR